MSIYHRFSDKELDILRVRAQKAAHNGQEDKPKNLLTALVVVAGEEVYALPIEAIANVYEGVLITPIPCVPPFVSGIANLRGYIVLALDLAVLLGVSEQTKSETATLAVLANGELAVALHVKGIRGIETLPVGDLAPIPANIELKHAAYISGVLPDGTALLNIDSILNDPRLIIDSEQV